MSISKNKIKELSTLETEIFNLKKRYSTLEQEITKRSVELLTELNEYYSIKYFSELEFEFIDEAAIFFKAVYYKEGGEYGVYEHQIPTELLYNEVEKEKYIKNLVDKQKKDLEETNKSNKALELKRIEEEKKKYLELKKKYG